MNSIIVKAFEDAWKDIQFVHPEVPKAVIVVGSGGTKAPTTYGHFASNTWVSDGQAYHEVLIVAEHLNRSPRDLFNTLLHEAAHGLAEARGIKDVSGKRHNRKFLQLTEELGMEPPEKAAPTIGFSNVQMYEETELLYMKAILGIEGAVQFHRSLKLKAKETQKNSWIAECGCERKFRVGKPMKEAADQMGLAIICNLCGTEFELEDE